MTAPTLAQLQADADAISKASPATRRFAQDAVAYLRSIAAPVPPVPPPPPAPPPPTGWTPGADARIVETFAAGKPSAALLTETSAPQGGQTAAQISYGTIMGQTAACLTTLPLPYNSSIGNLAAIYLPNGSPIVGAAPGQESWYHSSFLFPAGSQFPAGRWDWLVEWHNDPAASQYTVSGAIGVYCDYPVSSTPGTNPQLAIRWVGGPVTSPTFAPSAGIVPVAFDHWYDSLVRVVWNVGAAGLIEWYLDGTQVYTAATPTLQQHPDGTPDQPAFGVYNYHYNENWRSDVWHTNIAIGPTRVSVGG